MGAQQPGIRGPTGTFHRSAALHPRKRELQVGQMGRAEQYRWFAVRCLEIARTTLDPQTKAAMLQMAQVWSRLADENQSVGHPRAPAS
jgi:hypothetical protein